MTDISHVWSEHFGRASMDKPVPRMLYVRKRELPGVDAETRPIIC